MCDKINCKKDITASKTKYVYFTSASTKNDIIAADYKV